MKKGWKMNNRSSRKLFKKTADRTHKFNLQNRNSRLFMRGGIRL